MQKTRFVKDLKEGEPVRDLFLVANKALLTSNDKGPRALAARATSSWVSPASARSHVTTAARPPCPPISATKDWASSREAWQCTATAQPAAARSAAMARPMPRAAPVTSAVPGAGAFMGGSARP